MPGGGGRGPGSGGGNGTAASSDMSRYVIPISLVQTSAIIFGNALIIVTILLNKHLRNKDFLLFLGLAVADFLLGTHGVYHKVKKLAYSTTPVSVWECVSSMQQPLSWLGVQAQAYMLLLLSANRLIAIGFLSLYNQFTEQYSVKLLVSVVLACLAFQISVLLSVYFNPLSHEITAPLMACNKKIQLVLPAFLSIYHRIIANLGGYGCVALYIAVLIAFRKNMTNAHQGIQIQQLKLQKRLTITLGFIVLSSLLFNCVPATISLLKNYFFPSLRDNSFGSWSFVLKTMSSLVNIIIYAWRQKDMRQAMKNMLRCSAGAGTVTVQPTSQRSAAVGVSSRNAVAQR